MTALVSAWIASIAGALLFFVAGFFTGRRPPYAGRATGSGAGPARRGEGSGAASAARERPAQGALQAERQRDRAVLIAERDALTAEREQLLRQRAALTAEREQLLGQRAALTAGRDTLIVERDALTRQRDALISERAALIRERAALTGERDTLRGERDTLRGERDTLRGERDTLRGEREDLTQQAAELRDQLANAERVAAAISELRGAADARAELLVQLEVQKRRLRELEHHRDENAFLRRAAGESAALRRRLEELSSELAALHAQGFVRTETPRPVLLAPVGAGGTAAALQALLDGITAQPGMRSAALADDLGLLIAGVGEHADPLAAFAGFLDGIAAKTREFLPMAPLRRVTVEDHNGAAVSACPVTDGDARIALVTLTVGGVPATEQMTRLAGTAAAALR